MLWQVCFSPYLPSKTCQKVRSVLAGQDEMGLKRGSFDRFSTTAQLMPWRSFHRSFLGQGLLGEHGALAVLLSSGLLPRAWEEVSGQGAHGIPDLVFEAWRRLLVQASTVALS